MTSLRPGSDLSTEFLVIGAGPTGLGAGVRLQEAGKTNFLIADAAERVGGLARSFVDDQGFWWDIGGHVQFSHYPYFDALMDRALPGGWNVHERESWVWMRDRFVPYPFQNNLRYLPKEDAWKCLDGLLTASKADHKDKPKSFAEWIDRTFGAGIAEVFMTPYNFKVWATPPPLMNYRWIGERVAVTDLRRVLGNVILGKDDLSWGPNATFRFPKEGGTGAIWEAVADLVGRERFWLNNGVTRILPKEKVAVFADGSKVRYEHLLSTIPLDKLVKIVDGLSPSVVERAQGLVHSSTNVVGIGLEGQPEPELRGKCWMYYPENNCPFYRSTVFSHYAQKNVPDPTKQWSLMLEISESSHKPVNVKTVIDETVAGLYATKMITKKDKIVSRWHVRMEHGYPVPSLERDAILDEVQPALEKLGVFSRGRFGAWKYEVSNQDHSLMQGVEWADRAMFGTAESTVHGKMGLGAKEAPLPLPSTATKRKQA